MNAGAAQTRSPDLGREASREVRAGNTPLRLYLRALSCGFVAFNSVRVFAYLPNIWSIVQQGESSQHSLLTWLILLGANATMAAWLYEEHGQRMGKTVAVSIGNAAMCLLTAVVIGVHRV